MFVYYKSTHVTYIFYEYKIGIFYHNNVILVLPLNCINYEKCCIFKIYFVIISVERENQPNNIEIKKKKNDHSALEKYFIQIIKYTEVKGMSIAYCTVSVPGEVR